MTDTQPFAVSAPADIPTPRHSLIMMALVHGIPVDEPTLMHQYGGGAWDTRTWQLAARSLGMKTRLVQQDAKRLAQAPLPAVAFDRAGRFFILGKFDAGNPGAEDPAAQRARLVIHHPGEQPKVVGLEAFLDDWDGRLILVSSKVSFAAEAAKFDFSWFIPAVVKYRRLLGEVLLISLVLQLIGLTTPLFFQVIMDKVLVNHALQTLNVIAIGLICATVFEALLQGVRTYVFSQTSSKLDVELGARLFKHLLSLPIAYFQARRVGDSVARVRELENIRSFLTGNGITLLLDILFSFVFFTVMFFYSVPLTCIVLASIPIYVGISLVFTPILRKRLDDKFLRGAENQSFLVETVSGVDTVKALAVEPRWQQTWEKQLASYVAAGVSTTNISIVSSGAVSLISKLVTAGIMWLGAQLVLENKMTVGELVAFNMFASQVSSPILRLAQLWNDFQQVGISMSRLGDILNTRVEMSGQRTRMPALAGAIEFDQVSFRYRPDASDAIRGVSFKVAAGEVIGIVGASGSGKSTLTKLVQRFYAPDRGRVLIDGQDIAIVDTASLRRQIGVVLQETNLFSRSIRDNIALSNPAMPVELVIASAKLAGAHDFICELPEGYDTMVGEHGVGLSGGQRQRIAIARALMGNPRILIFDEATSALDYESEKVIQDNMRGISQGRTLLVIAHRLSSVRDANRIVVMERGQVAEVGTHDTLLANPKGIYRRLYDLQQDIQKAPSASGLDTSGSRQLRTIDTEEGSLA